MTKALDAAIAKIRQIPDDRQDFAAALMLHFVAIHTGEYALTPEQETMLREAAAWATEGEYADQPALEALLRKFGG